MVRKTGSRKSNELIEENRSLRERLEEAAEALRAIREGEVDAIIVSGSRGEQVFSLTGSESVCRLILETMKESALTVSFDGKVLFCNEQFANLIQTPHEKILGKRLQKFVHPDEHVLLDSIIEKSKKKAVRQRILFRSAKRDGVPAHLSASVLHQPDGISICIVATDLTELESSTEMLHQLQTQREALAQSEQRFRELAENLEKRIQERTAELTKTVDQLNSEIARRRSVEEELLARTNQLSRMASQLTVAEEQERRRIMEILHDHVQQLLVGAKLRIAGLGRNPDKLPQAAEDLEKILTQSIDLTRSLTSELSPPVLHQSGFAPALEWLSHWMKERHGLDIRLEADSGMRIESEETSILLFQTVRELLFNIVKHARTSRAHVCANELRGQIRIQVSDEGVGFDPAQIRPQSDRFGLFSIRERLNSMGGCIEMEAAPGKGCRVTITVPQRKPAEAVPESRRSGPRSIRILVVDDHVIMRQGLAHLLKAQPDMDVVGEASDGQAAVRMARQCLPDVIVMDMSMPVMNGPEATRIIHSEMPDIQVIGLSMFEEEEKAEIMRRAGAVRYLTKTGPSNLLIAAIRDLARSARLRSVTH